ncbi:M56 family metallopeptidase [Emticicia sp. 17c]|uniref:M56 family metallopeptidase n=1 Tax=Emticicia sp. 17c TaxID=3127704 RepID=UPI00301D3CAA
MIVLIYLLKVNLGLVAFYAFYWAFLRKNTFFQTNRFYLLCSVVASFLMPLIKVRHNYNFEYSLPLTLNELPTEVIKTVVYQPVLGSVSNRLSFHWVDLLAVIYLVGVLVFSTRFIFALVKIYFLLRDSEPIDVSETRTGRNYWLLRTNKAFSSYSFFNFLILNKEDAFYNRAVITDHEEVHIGQGHSWDIFFIEITHIFCWFNPLLLSYKESLRKLHEFIADSIVEGAEVAPYAQFLFAYNFKINASTLANDFFKDSLLKQRIQMMMKERTPLWYAAKYIFILPLVICFGYFVAAQDIRRVRINDVVPAEYVGGLINLELFFSRNFSFPEAENRAVGNIYLSFTVTKEGQVSDIHIDKGLRVDYDNETYNILSKMAEWIPAEKRKNPALSRVFLKITFNKTNEVTMQQYAADPAFRGVLIVDNEQIDYGDKLYSEDYALIVKDLDKTKVSYLRLNGSNEQLENKYGNRAKYGVDFWMDKYTMAVIVDGKEVDMKGGVTSISMEESAVEVLTPQDATHKLGKKALNGAIVIKETNSGK